VSETAPVDMRDIRALRNDLVEVAEEASRQNLAAHLRTLAILTEQASEQAAFRAEMRGWMARSENRTLAILQGVPHPPARPEVAGSTLAAWAYRARRRLDGPVTLRALVYGLAVAGLAASATSCALHLVH
jgi:hypothetical protein